MNRRIFLCCQLLCTALVLWIGSPLLLGQGERGALTGVIRDSSGAVVPGVEVIATNAANGVTFTVVSTEAGVYRIPYLPPGTYNVTASLPGFKTAVASGAEVRIAQVATVDIVLEIGEVSDQVTVSADTSLVKSTSELGTITTEKEVATWPILLGDGLRQLQTFVFKSMPGTQGSTFRGNINGGQAYSHEILIEGLSLGRFDLTGGSNNEFSPSIESANEFKVQTGSLSAQYGGTQTAVTNFGMKSGGNSFHGAAYWFHKNKVLSGNTWANNAFNRQRSPILENNFGATFGGPIIKDRTHFFFNYEAERLIDQRVTGFENLPTADFRKGNFSRLLDPKFTNNAKSGTVVGQDALGRNVVFGQIYDPLSARQLADGSWIRDPFAGNIIPDNRLSSVIRQALAQGDLPLPQFDQFERNFARAGTCCPKLNIDIYSAKIDHVLNGDHKIRGYFTYSNRWRNRYSTGNQLAGAAWPGPFLLGLRRQDTPGHILRLSEDWTISSNKFNHLAFGYNRFGNHNQSVYAHQNIAERIGMRNVGPGAPPMFTFGGSNATLSGGYRPMGDTAVGESFNGSWIAADDFTWLRGAHNFRMGFELRRYYYNNRSVQNGGSFAFHDEQTGQPGFIGSTGFAYASFLLGAARGASLGVPRVSPGRRAWNTAFYFQDDWKFRRNLTLNLGVRWDIPGALREVADRMAGLDPKRPNPGADGFPGALVFLGDCSGCTGSSAFEETYFKQIAPRLGFAWNPSDKLVIRSGYGINFSAPIMSGFSFPYDAGFNGSHPVNPRSGRFAQDPSLYLDRGYPAFTTVLPNRDPAQRNNSTVGWLLPETIQQPYVQNWTFGLQYQLPGSTVIEANYIASKGSRLEYPDYNSGLNQLDPKHLALGNALLDNISKHPQIAKPYPSFNGTVAQALRPFPQYQSVVTHKYAGAASSYHSFQLTATRRSNLGLSYLLAYTLSKSIAQADETIDGTGGQNFYNRNADKSITSLHYPHSFRLTWIYDLPFGVGRRWMNDGIVAAVLGGWTFSAIHNYQSGDPLRISASGFPGDVLFNPGFRADVLLPADQQKLGDVSNVDAVKGTAFLNPAAFARPPATNNNVPLRLGNAPRYLPNVRTFAFRMEDISLTKKTPIGFREGAMLEIRMDMVNLFNRAGIGGPVTDITNVNFGRIFGNKYGPRTAQFGLRISF